MITAPTPEYLLIVAVVFAGSAFGFYMAERNHPRRRTAVYHIETEDDPVMPDEANVYVQGVLPLQIKAQPELVEKLRAAARTLAAGGREITSDDVHEVCPVPPGVDPRIMGAVFHPRSEWQRVGTQPSRRRDANHGRWISRWALRESAPRQ